MADKPPVIFLMGPTASGKTDLAAELVQRLPLEIISVDSALVYRHMNIGTAKPDARVLAVAPHHLIDIREPTESYSAANFREDALALMTDITARGRIPLLVGGTMLYFKALENGLADLPASDPLVRQHLEHEKQATGLPAMHRRLRLIDPQSADRINANDPQRLLRALEVYELSGQTLTVLLSRQKDKAMPFTAIKLIRAPADRAVLHQRIADRFKLMLAQGFEQEVRDLMTLDGFSTDLPSMRSVGYRQMITHLQGETTAGEMLERSIIATRQLAKRQFTWLRKESDAHWLGDDLSDLAGEAEHLLRLEG